MGGLIIATTVPAGIFTRERYARLAAQQPKFKLGPALKATAENKYFWKMFGTGLMLGMGLAMFEAMGLYVNIYYVFGGDKKTGAIWGGYVGTLGTVLAIASVPLVWWLAGRLGKHVTLRLALVWMFIGSLLKWWCYNPRYPYLMFVLPFFYSIGISSVFVLIASMNIDVIDTDELRTGRRREAMFTGFSNWMGKLAGSLAVALSGWLIRWTGFDPLLGGAQAEATIFKMRFFYSFAMAAMVLLALVCTWGYDLTAKRIHEIRDELERRRAAATSPRPTV